MTFILNKIYQVTFIITKTSCIDEDFWGAKIILRNQLYLM